LACSLPKSSRAERLRRALPVALAGAAAAASIAFAAAPEGAAPAKEPIPFKREADALEPGRVLSTALALGLVIAVGIGGIYALKRFLPGSLGGVAGAPGRIKVLEVRRVTPKLTLLLLEIDGQKIALAQSGDRVRPLELKPEP
jgi:flagellar biogenesis protein FliO